MSARDLSLLDLQRTSASYLVASFVGDYVTSGLKELSTKLERERAHL